MADQSERRGFTPGDWQVGVHPVRMDVYIIKPVMMGDRVVKMPECEGGHAGFRNPADARVMAASKDLYEAVDLALEHLIALQVSTRNAARYDGKWEGAAEAMQPAIDQARAAKAKADGRDTGGDDEG